MVVVNTKMTAHGELRPGLIFEIAEHAGITLPRRSGKVPIRCPLHDDRHASAFLSESNVFYCSACTADGGWTAKKFADAVGQPWDRFREQDRSAPIPPPFVAKASNAFGPADAERTWTWSIARARDDRFVNVDRPAYDYLISRKLMPSWEDGAFGILAEHQDLHEAIKIWSRRRYVIIAPLFDQIGNVVCVQARGLEGCDPKTLFPAGSRIAGSVFADPRGRRVLADGAPDFETIVFGEGMTDMLALTIASPFPVLTAPGTSNAVAACGPWARGRRVIVALDNDAAGQKALQPVVAALYQHGARSVSQVRWPGGAKDACDVLERHGPDALGEFLRREPTARVA